MIIFDVGDLVWCLECMLLFLLVCTGRVIRCTSILMCKPKIWLPYCSTRPGTSTVGTVRVPSAVLTEKFAHVRAPPPLRNGKVLL